MKSPSQFRLGNSDIASHVFTRLTTLTAAALCIGAMANAQSRLPGGTKAMASFGSSLYIMQNQLLHHVKPENGSWRVVGSGNWRESSSMAVVGGMLYVIQNRRLHRVHPVSGTWTVLGPQAWNGSAAMTALGSNLYIEQDGTLHRVETIDNENGAWKVLGPEGAWKGTDAMAALNNSLYIVQGGTLHRVDTINNEGGAWHTIEPKGAWKDTDAMVALGNHLYIVQGGTLHRVTIRNDTATWELLGPKKAWSGTDAMAALNNSLYIVEGGTLHRVDTINNERGVWDVLGPKGVWAGQAKRKLNIFQIFAKFFSSRINDVDEAIDNVERIATAIVREATDWAEAVVALGARRTADAQTVVTNNAALLAKLVSASESIMRDESKLRSIAQLGANVLLASSGGNSADGAADAAKTTLRQLLGGAPWADIRSASGPFKSISCHTVVTGASVFGGTGSLGGQVSLTNSDVVSLSGGAAAVATTSGGGSVGVEIGLWTTEPAEVDGGYWAVAVEHGARTVQVVFSLPSFRFEGIALSWSVGTNSVPVPVSAQISTGYEFMIR